MLNMIWQYGLNFHFIYTFQTEHSLHLCTCFFCNVISLPHSLRSLQKLNKIIPINRKEHVELHFLLYYEDYGGENVKYNPDELS